MKLMMTLRWTFDRGGAGLMQSSTLRHEAVFEPKLSFHNH
jgi:hypothetical protein|tara:strand:- start:253 stop:372 length:120 start_codon:yes stop_codon:yes gene_type:complete